MARVIALAWCGAAGLAGAAAFIGLLLPAVSLRVSPATAAAFVVLFVALALAAGFARTRPTAREQA